MSTTPRGTKRSRRRPSEFLLPDGRKVLVALPEEAETLRQKYTSTNNDPPVQVEVVVHGSDEHRHFLRQSRHAREHHESRRQALRDRLGDEVFEELHSVSSQLNAVTAQLEQLTNSQSGSAASLLRSNFSKFGFDAHLRTYADSEDDQPPALSRSSTISPEDDNSAVVVSDRVGGQTIKLFKRPVIKQYFHRGLLWRAAEETEVMSFELFFDLLYVGIIAINGDRAAEEANGHELLRFIVTFIMSWKIWSDVTQLVSWFETGDILQRLEILFLVAALLGQTTNMLQTFSEDEGHDTFTQLVGFYLAARLFMAAYCALTTYLVPLVKGMMMAQVVNVLVGAALWIGSTQLHGNQRLALVWVAICWDLFASTIHVLLFRYSRSHSTPAAKKIGTWFEFYPAINIEHKVERTNAFVTLVLGYSVVGVLYQNQGVFGLNAFLGKAVLGLVQAFVFNWLYFEVDGTNIHTHAIRRHANTAWLWQYAHLSFIMSFILASASLSKIVLSTDCANAPLETLTEFYQSRSADHVSLGLRFYYCHGLAIALLSTGLISLSHEHKILLTCRLPKWARLTDRLGVCIILFALPAVPPEALNSLHLVAVTTSLSVWVLLFEIWGKSCKDESFFMRGNEDRDQCRRYTARCSKRQLDEALKRGGDGEVEVDVVELGKSEKTAVPDLQ
ncbi:bacterial low temperature requirement A protein-domain-containing protein [Diplogelasinospora grovesii]|uniref:Bacterial low temperature requirement A protein-domain-containing protein n=1 Tax=Diplogelasinospora grovesii TaxID=303347 RepID=A0AAN6NHV9_9PEZI|nr:bacterial low temperature requirement A protein-domain-containing protein [Diplogelasinospora grovesii]